MTPPSGRALRGALVALTFVASVGLVGRPCASQAPPASAHPLHAIADEYLAARFRNSPAAATIAGVNGARPDLLDDNSLAVLAAQQRDEDRMLAALEQLPRGGLTERQDVVTYGLLLEALQSSRQARVCRRELMPTSWVSNLSTLAAVQPVGTDSLRRAALARFAEVPAYLDTDIANSRRGLRLGYALPRDVVRREIARVEALVALPREKSPFDSPAVRDSVPMFRAAYESLFEHALEPAFRRYRDFLVNEYLPAAREAISVSANPNGAACYRALIRRYTTVDRDPREIQALGAARMEGIQAAMRALGGRVFGTSDLPSIFARLRSDTAYTFRSREDIVAAASASIERARLAMPAWFGVVPAGNVVVQPFPSFLERGAPPGQYSPAPDDGSRPATYRVNTYQPEQRGRGDLEDVTFHEAIPGHHVQMSIARQRTGVHPVTRYLGNAAFTEGWGLYAEGLADEMGLYSSDVGRLGMLNGEAARAARLVVDAGIHALGWSRQQAIDYLTQHATASPDQIAAEVDRYIAAPGQATAYMIGMLEIRRLRTEAETRLGSRFDIREFHDRVLEDGAVTMPMLQDKIEDWIVQQSAHASGGHSSRSP